MCDHFMFDLSEVNPFKILDELTQIEPTEDNSAA